MWLTADKRKAAQQIAEPLEVIGGSRARYEPSGFPLAVPPS
jgi:hypothetical protein